MRIYIVVVVHISRMLCPFWPTVWDTSTDRAPRAFPEPLIDSRRVVFQQHADDHVTILTVGAGFSLPPDQWTAATQQAKETALFKSHAPASIQHHVSSMPPQPGFIRCMGTKIALELSGVYSLGKYIIDVSIIHLLL